MVLNGGDENVVVAPSPKRSSTLPIQLREPHRTAHRMFASMKTAVAAVSSLRHRYTTATPLQATHINQWVYRSISNL